MYWGANRVNNYGFYMSVCIGVLIELITMASMSVCIGVLIELITRARTCHYVFGC